MATLEQFKQLATTPEEISALASEFVLEEEKTTAKMIQMAADKGFELTSDEIIQHLNQMHKDDEFSDVELSTEALAAVAGGVSDAMYGTSGSGGGWRGRDARLSNRIAADNRAASKYVF